MADGIRCKHCGYQETDHELKDRFPEAAKKLRGYRVSLELCVEFVPPKRFAKVAELTDEDEQSMGREARRRYAFGAYQTHVAQERFESELGKKERAVRNASGETERKKAQADKDEFLETSRRRAHLILVG